MRKIIATALIFCICCLIFAGCGDEGNNVSLVYILNSKPEAAAVYEEIAKKYKQEKGVEVKVVTTAGSYAETLKSEIAKTEAPTIFHLNGAKGYDEWKDYCLDLRESRLYTFLTDKTLGITEKGSVYALPYTVEGYGIIYNNAVMDKYFSLKNRQKKISSISEIENFDAFKLVVEDMQKLKGELGIDGVFASSSMASGEAWPWHTHLLNIPLYYEFKNNRNADPVLSLLEADEINFRYSQNFKNVFDLYTENSLTKKTDLKTKSVADSIKEFAQGKAAMMQNGSWVWQQIKEVKGNVVKENDIKMLPIYTGVAGEEKQGLCIGSENYFAVNKNVSKEKRKASLDFLEWLFSSKTGKKYVTEKLGFVTPFNTFSENETPNDPLSLEILKHLHERDKQRIPWIFSAFPSDKFKTTVESGLLNYLEGTKKWSEIEDSIKSSWKEEKE